MALVGGAGLHVPSVYQVRISYDLLFGRYGVFCVLASIGLVTFTLKLVRKLHVWWATFLLILGFLHFFVLE